MPQTTKQQKESTSKRESRQTDDNIDDLGRNVTGGEVDKKRHPQVDKVAPRQPK